MKYIILGLMFLLFACGKNESSDSNTKVDLPLSVECQKIINDILPTLKEDDKWDEGYMNCATKKLEHNLNGEKYITVYFYKYKAANEWFYYYDFLIKYDDNGNGLVDSVFKEI